MGNRFAAVASVDEVRRTALERAGALASELNRPGEIQFSCDIAAPGAAMVSIVRDVLPGEGGRANPKLVREESAARIETALAAIPDRVQLIALFRGVEFILLDTDFLSVPQAISVVDALGFQGRMLFVQPVVPGWTFALLSVREPWDSHCIVDRLALEGPGAVRCEREFGNWKPLAYRFGTNREGRPILHTYWNADPLGPVYWRAEFLCNQGSPRVSFRDRALQPRTLPEGTGSILVASVLYRSEEVAEGATYRVRAAPIPGGQTRPPPPGGEDGTWQVLERP
jgi:hypothetical protein